MSKVMKIFAVVFMALVLISTSTSMAFAAIDFSGIIDDVDSGITGNPDAASGLVGLAGKVIGLIQIASVVAAIILVAVFGFKFIMGSANEKADYQKSFIPLIVGVVVVFASTSIAKLLFGLIG